MDGNNAVDRWLTAEEAARHLGYSVRTIYDKVQRDEIPHQRIGRSLRFRRSQLDAWVEGHDNSDRADDAPGRGKADLAA